jgi:tryptophan 7-halogenase
MIKTYVILGGGTAGWMTAAALSRFISPAIAEIVLVESDAIGTVGVGEATIPHIRVFNQLLGLDEQIFMQSTHATYKLGIRFEGWGEEASRYYHPFGAHGMPINNLAFHHYWIHAKKTGISVGPFDEYAMANVVAEKERFSCPSDDPAKIESTFSYAYHIDAGAYAALLRCYSEERGVTRIEGEVAEVQKNTDSGFIEKLVLKNGQQVSGEFFIDCSGFRARLLGDEMEVPFVSWKQWLLCDRAVAVPTEINQKPVPYTRSIAKASGWCWQIPLRHRVGNGYVFSSEFCSEEEAKKQLVGHVSGDLLAEPRSLQFEAGMRCKSWEKNCVAIGLSSGFLEPLESTSIYLIEAAILKLLELLPESKDCIIDAEEFNRQIQNEYEKVRDFIILHYCLNRRAEPFWRHCAQMKLPDSLERKIEIFKATAKVVDYDTGLFLPPSWLAVYLGQGMIPNSIDSRINYNDFEQSLKIIENYREALRSAAHQMPPHYVALENKNFNSSQPRLSLYGVRR